MTAGQRAKPGEGTLANAAIAATLMKNRGMTEAEAVAETLRLLKVAHV